MPLCDEPRCCPKRNKIYFKGFAIIEIMGFVLKKTDLHLCRYKVAGHLIEVSQNIGDNFFTEYMDNYIPFVENRGETDECLFSLAVEYGESVLEYTEELRQDEDGALIICGVTAKQESVFDFRLSNEAVGLLVCAVDYKSARLFVPRNQKQSALKFAVNNAIMVLYAIASAPYDTALFHAAAVSYNNRGYLFLGVSGTGKSTHAQLWLKHIACTDLLNDDNPVVRVYDEAGQVRVVVYGSPWSGKTPCYKNQEFVLGGFVLLSQAPHNKIARLRGVQAFAALVPCISGKRWERVIADGLHKTENALAMNVPVWYLECLPDEAAAKLCCKNVSAEEE